MYRSVYFPEILDFELVAVIGIELGFSLLGRR